MFSLGKSKNIITNLLSNGGVVVLPTDTIYSLSCLITNDKSLKRILEIKGRDISKGIPVLIPHKNYFYKYAENINSACDLLIDTFMPGGLTLIVRKKPFISNIISGNTDNIAIRIPDDPNLIKIMSTIKSGITGTSANISGKEHSLLEENLVNDLGEKVDMIVFGDYKNKSNNPSTILDMTANKINVIREGKITINDIKNTGLEVQ
tara:strand:- start:539 stop:1156 length:618 start_codon:yes stop_codon:yes gene_type:complete